MFDLMSYITIYQENGETVYEFNPDTLFPAILDNLDAVKTLLVQKSAQFKAELAEIEALTEAGMEAPKRPATKASLALNRMKQTDVQLWRVPLDELPAYVAANHPTVWALVARVEQIEGMLLTDEAFMQMVRKLRVRAHEALMQVVVDLTPRPEGDIPRIRGTKSLTFAP